MDNIRADFPDRCINVGIAEGNMIGISAGMAMSGKIVFVYTMTPFVTMRCYEQLRIDVCLDGLPVKTVGVGPGVDYSTLGPTHHGLEDIALMRLLPGMQIFSPCDDTQAMAFCRVAYNTPGPCYIRLDRNGQPTVYSDNQEDFSQGLTLLKKGQDLMIIATGRMVLTAMRVIEDLSKHSISGGVIDIFRIKPFNRELLLQTIGTPRYIATLEEHSIIGGLGTAVAEVLAESSNRAKFIRLGLPDGFCRRYGTRQFLYSDIGIDREGIAKTLSDMLIK
jgi:transketolase